MKSIAIVYSEKPDFNYGNALISYTIAHNMRYHGFNVIIIAKTRIPTINIRFLNISSYVYSIPNIIVETWIKSTDISIILSELFHDEGLDKIVCYGLPCLLGSIPIKIYSRIKNVYIPSETDVRLLTSSDGLMIETYNKLLGHAIKYADLIFDYELHLQPILKNLGLGLENPLMTNNPKILEEFLLN